MNKKVLIAAGAGLTAAGIIAADILATKIVESSVVMPDDIRNTFPPETNLKHKDDPGIETVWMRSFDGTELLGHWYPCKDAVRSFVCMHGWHGSWLKDFGDIIDFLHENGCNVLLPDERGQNGSKGDFMGFALLEKYDCMEWIKWLNYRTGTDLPVYLYGVSMGSATVMMTSELNLPGNVKGVIADCGFTSAQDIWRHLTHKRVHLPYSRLLARQTEYKYTKMTGAAGTHRSTIEALSNCDLPVLFVHGDEDDFVPAEMSYRNHESFEGDSELLIIKGAGHAVNYRTDPASYEAAVRRLWAKCENK